jgi:hypothetical protein
MNVDLFSPPREQEMPAASAQARRQHLVREAQRTRSASRRRWIGAFTHLSTSRKLVFIAIAAVALIAAAVGTASAVGWLFDSPIPDMDPASGTAVTYHQRTMVNGQEWAVVTYRNSEGKLCLGLKSGGGLGRSCTTERALFSEGPLAINTGWTSEGGASGAWLFGFTQAPVKKVLVQFGDCSERSLPLDADGIFLYVTPGPYAAPGSPDQRLPQRVIALDDAGVTLATKDVPEVKAKDCQTP